MPAPVDEIDRKIVDLLRQDARLTNAALGAQVGLSAPSVSLTMAAKAGVITRLEASGMARKAEVMSSRNCERMMQPARQILAMVASGRFQPFSSLALGFTVKPWA